MANTGLPKMDTLRFDEDGNASVCVPQLAGEEFDIVPTKLQGRTVLKYIAEIPATDGEIVSFDEILMGNATVSDIVETLRSKPEMARETFLNALSDSAYQDVISHISQYVPASIQFIRVTT